MRIGLFLPLLFFFLRAGGGAISLHIPSHPPQTYNPTPSLPLFFDLFDPDPTPVERTGTDHWNMERAKQTDQIIAKSSRIHST